jgi:hypothetical protein
MFNPLRLQNKPGVGLDVPASGGPARQRLLRFVR